MGTYEKESLSSALFGKTRRALLGIFFSHSEKSFYVREIARWVKTGHGSVQRELANLCQVGILKRVLQGNQVYYQANPSCPIYEELQGLIRKTAGLAEVLQQALAPLSERIQTAFIYGSQAAGIARESSDIDLMIIGEADELEIHRVLMQAEKQLARSVNYTCMSPQEYRKRAKEKGGFIQRVMKGKKIYILGEPGHV